MRFLNLQRWLACCSIMLASAAASGALVKFDGGPVAGCSLSGKTYTNCAASVFNAANDFEVGSSHIVYADIVGDSVKLGSSSEVHGNITATAVELNSHSEVFGNISASDLVTLGSNSSITGSVVAGNSISLSSHSDITGNVSATNVTLANNTTITGNVTAITVISSGNIGGTTTCSTFNGATNPCAVAGPHHYELSMPSTGINCLPNTVTVTACANSSSPCTSRSTTLNGKQATLGASTGGLLSSTAVTFDGAGVATATLSYPSVSGPVTVTLSGEQIAAANARTCCPNGAACSTSNSCSATFDTSGFIFSSVSGATGNLANQVAGTASGSQYLRAVKSDNTTMACGAALVGTQAVSLAYECKDPTACSGSNLMLVNSTTIARNDNAASTTYLPVNLTFDANGNAPFIIRFDDVGQVILRARKIMPNSAVLNGFSNPFIVKPGGFVLSAIKQTASPFFANPAADLAFDPALPRTRDTAFVRAGEAFSVTATATTSGGAATPNFGKETTPEGVQLLVSAANDPAFSAPFADMLNLPALSNGFPTFSAGVATGTTFAWNDVGIINLTPVVASRNYLDVDVDPSDGVDVGDVIGTPQRVGRFIPSYLAVTPGAVTNRSATPACAASSFTYMGEPMTANFTLTAKAAGGATTQNYRGKFAKFDPAAAAASGQNGQLALAAVDAGTPRTPFSACGATPAHACIQLGAATAATAAGVVAVVAPATVFRGAAAVGPFNNFQLGVAPEDGDGVAARSADFDIDTVNVVAAAANHARVGTTAALYGRLKIDNAYGSELLRLPVPLAAQFWNGNRYVANAADNCTPLAAANFNVAAGAGVAVATAIEAGATMVNGSGTNFRLARPNPTPAGKGSVRLSTSAAAPAAAPLNSYLPGIGGGTFGVYKSGPVIFTREMY